ncbi:MAG: UPF0158 family protein [Pseudonocardia sp.]
MLDPDRLDLDELCFARDDRTAGVTWWIDPVTGELQAHGPDAETDRGPHGWVPVRSTEASEGYRDMAEFVATVQHPRAGDLLGRAIAGRGAFRRFKNTLHEFPELRDRWFRFRDARSRRRALRWLADRGLVSVEAAEIACTHHPDPRVSDDDLPTALVGELHALYGERLRQVLMFGPRAHGGGGPESDVELLVVLSELDSTWMELVRMDEVLWRHTERTGVSVTALPVSRAEFGRPSTPAMLRVRSGAVRIG